MAFLLHIPYYTARAVRFCPLGVFRARAHKFPLFLIVCVYSAHGETREKKVAQRAPELQKCLSSSIFKDNVSVGCVSTYFVVNNAPESASGDRTVLGEGRLSVFPHHATRFLSFLPNLSSCRLRTHTPVIAAAKNARSFFGVCFPIVFCVFSRAQDGPQTSPGWAPNRPRTDTCEPRTVSEPVEPKTICFPTF